MAGHHPSTGGCRLGAAALIQDIRGHRVLQTRLIGGVDSRFTLPKKVPPISFGSGLFLGGDGRIFVCCPKKVIN